MKFTIEKKNESLNNLMRKAGYFSIDSSFIRPLERSGYPRFHIYIEDNIINLHLDQKRPVYKGTTAHSGEYEGSVVENEVQRIKRIMNNEL